MPEVDRLTKLLDEIEARRLREAENYDALNLSPPTSLNDQSKLLRICRALQAKAITMSEIAACGGIYGAVLKNRRETADAALERELEENAK
jgi:hypothetical protein